MQRQTANTYITDRIFTKCYDEDTDFCGQKVDFEFIKTEFENQMIAYKIGISPKPIKYYEKVEDGYRYYCIDMELINGYSLEQRSDSIGHKNVEQLFQFISSALDSGLELVLKKFVFETSIRGWDCGLKNIMVDNRGKYYIIDFGQTYNMALYEEEPDDEKFETYIGYLCNIIFSCGINAKSCKFVKDYIKRQIDSGYFDNLKLDFSESNKYHDAYNDQCEKYN
jgi:serine/threonine protein kinase